MKTSAVLLSLLVAVPAYAVEKPQSKPQPVETEIQGRGPWVISNASEPSMGGNLVWALNTQTGLLMLCGAIIGKGIQCTPGGYPLLAYQLQQQSQP
jgi:hypothetical protein